MRLLDDAPIRFGDTMDLGSLGSLLSVQETAVPEPWIGLVLQDADALEEAAAAKGVRLSEVAPQGPGERAGLRRGDIIRAWNGEPVAQKSDLEQRINAMTVGTEVTLHVYRCLDQPELEIKVKAEDRAAYPLKDFWQPGLPEFREAQAMEQLFDDTEDEWEALTRAFEKLEASIEENASEQPVKANGPEDH